MNAVGVLLLAAATAGTGFQEVGSKPHAGGKRFFLRHHAVVNGPPPPGGMIGGGMGSPGCAFGHPGCAGGASCPGVAGSYGGGGMDPGLMMAGMGPGGGTNGGGRQFPNVRSQLFFVAPVGMQVGWQTAAGGGDRVYLPAQLTVPARYNFTQGYIYRLKLTEISGEPDIPALYPTIEVAPSTPATDAYLTHNAIPVQFTQEDFNQVKAGNFVTKVIYLPDPRYQELAIAGVETLVSTRLEPGIDPVVEADKRGTILMIIRLGGIDLEMSDAAPTGTATIDGGMMSTPDYGSQPGMMPDSTYPDPNGGYYPAEQPMQPSEFPPTVPVDEAPVTPISPETGPFPTPPDPSIPGGGELPPDTEAEDLGLPGMGALPPIPSYDAPAVIPASFPR